MCAPPLAKLSPDAIERLPVPRRDLGIPRTESTCVLRPSRQAQPPRAPRGPRAPAALDGLIVTPGRRSAIH
jgi:hypothetical protein